MNSITSEYEVIALTANDRCDSCGSQAYVRAFFEFGDLLFCAHHWSKHEQAAQSSIVKVIDQRHQLTPEKPIVDDDED